VPANIDLAATAARRGDDLAQQHDNPALVGFAWRVSIGVELAEGAKVYEDAMAAPVDIAALGSRERSSSLQFDLARVLAQEGGARDADVIRHLDTADRIAPQRIRSDPIARDLVLTLDRRAQRYVWELDSLRNRFGVGRPV
jgi:hypothetical protein